LVSRMARRDRRAALRPTRLEGRRPLRLECDEADRRRPHRRQDVRTNPRRARAGNDRARHRRHAREVLAPGRHHRAAHEPSVHAPPRAGIGDETRRRVPRDGDTVVMMTTLRWSAFVLAALLATDARAAVPTPTITGPITSPGSAFVTPPSGLDLSQFGWV